MDVGTSKGLESFLAFLRGRLGYAPLGPDGWPEAET